MAGKVRPGSCRGHWPPPDCSWDFTEGGDHVAMWGARGHWKQYLQWEGAMTSCRAVGEAPQWVRSKELGAAWAQPVGAPTPAARLLRGGFLVCSATGLCRDQATTTRLQNWDRVTTAGTTQYSPPNLALHSTDGELANRQALNLELLVL